MRFFAVLFCSSCLISSLPLATLSFSESFPACPAQTGSVHSDRTVADLLQEAKSDYERRAEEGKAHQALELYQQVLRIDPNHYEALWNSAQCYYWLGEQLPKDQKEQRRSLFTSGLDMAKRAKEVSPDSPEGHFWYGVLLGDVSYIRGICESLASVNPIIQSMEKVLSTNPKQGFAYHVLGMLYRMAPGWPLSCGNLDKSLKYAKLAVQCRPDSVLVHLGLAQSLLAKGQKDQAKETLIAALTLPGPAEYQPETKKEKEAVQALLSKIIAG